MTCAAMKNARPRWRALQMRSVNCAAVPMAPVPRRQTRCRCREAPVRRRAGGSPSSTSWGAKRRPGAFLCRFGQREARGGLILHSPPRRPEKLNASVTKPFIALPGREKEKPGITPRPLSNGPEITRCSVAASDQLPVRWRS